MSTLDTRVVPFTPKVGNQDFLEHLFGDRWREVPVASFRRDPSDPLGPREDWNAWPAGEVLGNPYFDQGNTYFCPSLIALGTRPRGPLERNLGGFRQLNAIVVDDIGLPSQGPPAAGTKIQLVDVVAVLRSKPTYVVETSPGNHQAGWKIEPETDLAWVKGMLTQLDHALGRGRADNLVNPIAWRRLPVGWNTKAALVSRLGPRGWRVRLGRDYPGPMIMGLDWPAFIEDHIGEITRLTTLERGVGDAQRPDAAALGLDPVYRALEEAGLILGEKITADKFWAATIRCPWIAGHGPTRPLSGAEYVPAVPGNPRGWFHCFHCENRNQGEFREQLDQVLRDEGAKIVAAFEFDEIDLKLLVPPTYALSSSGEAIDLWDQKAPPGWQAGVFPAVLEDTLFELALRDGLDAGALGATMITAASGAADKRTLLRPYAGSLWQVRPVLWTMLVAETGLRKTALLKYPLDRMRRLNLEQMRGYSRAITVWRGLPAASRRTAPAPTVAAILAEDVTVEKLQSWMADNPRGLLYLRDELVGLFDFGRYSSGPGTAERGFFLETYEGGPTTIGRMTRTTTIDNCALAVLGGIQQQKLADFKGLAEDGLLSRLGVVLQQAVPGGGKPVPGKPDVMAIDTTIDRLLAAGVFDDYRTDAAGENLIRETEKFSETMLLRSDLGIGFRGFLRKLHGVHARAALVLHLMDGGQDPVVPEDTVARAGLYTRFLYRHAEVFYAGLPGSADHTAQAIGSFILRQPKVDRVTAGQLRRDIAACRQLHSLKEIQDAVFLLVIGGWLRPETTYPTNYAWQVRPGLRDEFAARIVLETTRVDVIKAAMNQWGQYR